MTTNGYSDVKLHDLVDCKDPNAALGESLHIASSLHEGFDPTFLTTVFGDVVRLFRGDFPGYRHSTTMYHDLQHTAQVLLCTARLLHGATHSRAQTNGWHLSARTIELTLVAALLHDVGLIQEEGDEEGTGAKFTIGHEKRSVQFLKHYLRTHGHPEEDVVYAARMIDATCLGVKADAIDYVGSENEFGAHILATADLLAQMADREYLEKLLLLYLEFEEAGLPYDSPYDLLSKTHGFYELMENRMDGALGGVRRYSRPHFRTRWDIDRDLYADSIQANMEYLYEVLEETPETYLEKLKRGGIVHKVPNRLRA